MIVPPPIRTDRSNPFAQHTLAVRVPATIRAVARANPDYGPEIQAALEALAVALESNAVIPAPAVFWPDYAPWAALWAAHAGETWGATEWFYAEVYAYRPLIEAVHWRATGRDPFAPDKAEELARPALWQALAAALELAGEPLAARLAAAITLSLWGNRIDLSLAAVAAHGTAARAGDLLCDDHAAAVSHLLGQPPGAVHLICDNTGTELALDFALTDALLAGAAGTVTLHLKQHPTFVSDATLADAETLLARLAAHEAAPSAALADRLNAARRAGRLMFAPYAIWNSGYFLRDFPADVLAWFTGAALVVLKGDLNYRRLVDDALWPPATPFAEVAAFFPAPLLALRTIKGGPVVGLAPGQAESLDAQYPEWRTNGRHGVMQFRR